MTVTKIRVYDVIITGHLVIQALTDTDALQTAKDEVTNHQARTLNFALTEQDGWAYTAPLPPPV